ncbi:Hint domain-containing protein [Ruegeria sp. 2012CJ41-6]|uniref:Hint domain-containing protein n=1 Tax=Ruegeria spongiae TaxID=2942209 RepID=A0ABT0Q402_9RHOB|nr:Hint domain-containing protein [Ruegeria spongiae]MCL6284337.1 Hint domain-containing protein [Ruegeria spongiae]
MPVFLTLTNADINNASFWAGLDIGPNSTIDVSGVGNAFQITMTGSSITFTNTNTGAVTTYTNSDIASGSFSEFVEYTGNNNADNVSGSVGLNAGGYSGGRGNDTFTDDGSLGGAIDGGRGNDTLQGGVGDNNIIGGRGRDVLLGGSGNNILSGGIGRDTLFAEDGSGNLDGGAGRDEIHAGLNTSFVDGGANNDTLIVPKGSTVRPFFPGSTGGTVSLPGDLNSFTYQNIENVEIACFTEGTLIRTPEGEYVIEALQVGDLVETLDHGAQPIRWIGRRRIEGRGRHAPVRFATGTIGNDRPIRVSPQHRVLLSGWRCELLFHAPEVLCAARHLCDGDRIHAAPCDHITYVHLMFDRHEIVFCENAPLESFFAGEHILQADRACYDELVGLFPEIANGDPIAAARPFVRHAEGALLQARCVSGRTV